MVSSLFSDIEGDGDVEKNITEFAEDETMVELLTTLVVYVNVLNVVRDSVLMIDFSNPWFTLHIIDSALFV